MNLPKPDPGSTRWRQSSAALAVALAIVAAACSHRVEQRTLQDFFDASRLGDRIALGALATVRFDPSADGVVTAFTITSVETTDSKPLSDDPRAARIAALSLSTGGGEPRVARQSGQLASETVRASASVRLANGQELQKTVNVVMARAKVNGGDTTGRWIVTGFTAYAK
jgi:hypothetical protein